MASQQHLAILMQGKDAWNEWRKQNQDIHPDLSGANLRGADLRGIDFTEANLKRAHLENANLTESHLEKAYLREVHLEGANLDTTHLEGARLYRANLTGANLRYAYFDRTSNLDSIDLNEAKVADVRWGDVNLALVAWSRVIRLGDEEDVRHREQKRVWWEHLRRRWVCVKW